MARADRSAAAEPLEREVGGAEDRGSVGERPDEILTSVEACRFLKIGRTKLWELTRRSMLPAYRVGSGKTSGLRYKRSELMRWLERNRIQGGSETSRESV